MKHSFDLSTYISDDDDRETEFTVEYTTEGPDREVGIFSEYVDDFEITHMDGEPQSKRDQEFIIHKLGSDFFFQECQDHLAKQ